MNVSESTVANAPGAAGPLPSCAPRGNWHLLQDELKPSVPLFLVLIGIICLFFEFKSAMHGLEVQEPGSAAAISAPLPAASQPDAQFAASAMPAPHLPTAEAAFGTPQLQPAPPPYQQPYAPMPAAAMPVQIPKQFHLQVAVQDGYKTRIKTLINK